MFESFCQLYFKYKVLKEQSAKFITLEQAFERTALSN